MNCLWISWYPHRRTTGLCDAWNVPLRVISCSQVGLSKWLIQSVQTVRLVLLHRPQILFVQNPSLGLVVLALMLRLLFRFCLVVDAHNEGVRPFIRSNALVFALTRRLLRVADVTIVTNAMLACDVQAAGGRPLVLPDPLPEIAAAFTGRTDGVAPPSDVVIVATFAPDEPISAIMAAAARMRDVSFSVTGNVTRCPSLRTASPPNVLFTGFLPEKEYWALLARTRVICDLTLMEDCLVCGAYEALALAKPVVLSEGRATQEIFGDCAVLTSNSVESIEQALRTALDNRAVLESAALNVGQAYRLKWTNEAQSTWDTICSIAMQRCAVRSKEAGA